MLYATYAGIAAIKPKAVVNNASAIPGAIDVKELLCVNEHDNVSDFMNLANKIRYSYYPVVNEKDQCAGIQR